MAVGFNIKVGLDSSKVERGFASISKRADGLNRRMGHLSGSALKFGTAITAAAVAFAAFKSVEFFKDSSKKAGEFELMATSFEILLGSVSKAKDRIKELEQFSVVTPFEPTAIIKASKLLQTLAGDTMATGAGLKMVGDAAAGMTLPFEDVALHAGRLFQSLTQGGPAGEALARLQELGLMTGKFKREFAGLTEEQRKGKAPLLSNNAALEMMQKAFAGTEGAMSRLSSTFAGKISTMKGNVGLLKIAIGSGINRGLEDGVMAMNQKLPEMRAAGTALGEHIGLALSEALKGKTALLEATAGAAFLRVGEMAGAAFLFSMVKTITRGLPAVMEMGANMIENSPILKAGDVTGLQRKGLRAAAEGLRGMDKDEFNFGDFQKMMDNTLGSEAAAADAKEQTAILREMLERQKERDFLDGKRDIIDGAYGPLKIGYSR